MDYKSVYANLFNIKNYSVHGPDELRYQLACEFIKGHRFKSMVDIGSGRGVMLDLLSKEIPGLTILSTDLSKFHELDFAFKEVDLSNKDTFFSVDQRIQALTCLDVLEHLEHHCIDDVLQWFSEISDNQLMTIANHSEVWVGNEIHLIQENMSYWKIRLSKFLDIVSQDERAFTVDNGKKHYLYIFVTKRKT